MLILMLYSMYLAITEFTMKNNEHSNSISILDAYPGDFNYNFLII